MKFLPFSLKNYRESSTKASSMKFLSCGSTETLSFRATLNSTLIPTIELPDDEPSPCLSSSSTHLLYSAETEDCCSSDNHEQEEEENLIRGIMKRSSMETERLFFGSSGETSSILNEKVEGEREIDHVPIKVVEMESRDPCEDFKRSMEDMLEAHQGLRDDWEGLEELLSWYLCLNGKSNHPYIVIAFFNFLLLNLSSSSCSSSSLVFEQEQDEDDDDEDQTFSSCCSSNAINIAISTSSANGDSPISPLSFSSSSSSSSTTTTTSSASHSLSSLEEEEEEEEADQDQDDDDDEVVQTSCPPPALQRVSSQKYFDK